MYDDNLFFPSPSFFLPSPLLLKCILLTHGPIAFTSGMAITVVCIAVSEESISSLFFFFFLSTTAIGTIVNQVTPLATFTRRPLQARLHPLVDDERYNSSNEKAYCIFSQKLIRSLFKFYYRFLRKVVS